MKDCSDLEIRWGKCWYREGGDGRMEGLVDSTKGGVSEWGREQATRNIWELREAGHSSHSVCRLSVATVTGQRWHKIVSVTWAKAVGRCVIKEDFWWTEQKEFHEVVGEADVVWQIQKAVWCGKPSVCGWRRFLPSLHGFVSSQGTSPAASQGGSLYPCYLSYHTATWVIFTALDCESDLSLLSFFPLHLQQDKWKL